MDSHQKHCLSPLWIILVVLHNIMLYNRLMNNTSQFRNPFRPGAAHRPPYLAGREEETGIFKELLTQEPVLKNMVLTGLRGTGKTVLLEEFKPLALESKWLWAGTELSESASVSEATIATRVLTDLSILTANLLSTQTDSLGFGAAISSATLDFASLERFYNQQPGLVADKLKATLEYIWGGLQAVHGVKGIVLAYDEAQEMNDQDKKEQYPLSVLLSVIQSLQQKGLPFLLVLAGLPSLYPKLIERRGYAERMFKIVELKPLTPEETAKAISIPIDKEGCPVKFNESSVGLISEQSKGYPYFVQFICREAFDSFIIQISQGIGNPSVPLAEIIAKIDVEFFAPKWNTATDRERDLLSVVARLPHCHEEFTIKEVMDGQKAILEKPMSHSQISSMLAINLSKKGLVFRTPRHGKYTLGIPMLASYINRQTQRTT